MMTNTFWFTARGAGLSAMLLLSLATTLGAAGSIHIRSAAARVIIQYVHRTAALLGVSLVFVHVTTLVLDSKAHVSLRGAFVPFASTYQPNTVALGSIALYLLLILAASGLARGRMAASPVGARMWRGVHLLAYPTWGIALLHGLLSGTDRAQTWVELLNVVCVLAVVAAIAGRLANLDSYTRNIKTRNVGTENLTYVNATATALNGVRR